MRFSGTTYDPAQDEQRLTTQFQRVYDLMADGKYRTLAAIAQATDSSEAGVSARLRDFRKERFGSHTVNRRRVAGADGLWEYQLVVKRSEPVRESLFA